MKDSDRAVLVWSGRGGGGGARLAELAHRLGLEGKAGCAAYHLPATPNGRGVADAWAAAADADESNPEPISLLIVSGDEAAADPAVRVAGRAGRARARDHDVPGPRRRLGRPGPAGHLVPRARRLVPQPRGSRAASAARSDSARARRARLDCQARRALRRRALAARGDRVRGAVRARVRRHVLRRGRGARAAAGPNALRGPGARTRRPDSTRAGRAGRPLPRHPHAPALPAALLRAGRRARPRARLPASRARDRARRRRRRAPPDRRGRPGQRPLERDVGRRCARASAARSRPARPASPRSTRATSTATWRW